MKTLIGKKVGMTQIFDEKGRVIPVTVIEAGPCVVAQVKSVETDGYNAIQLGFGDVKESKLNNPEKGHFTKASIVPTKYLREFRVDSIENIKVEGSVFKVFKLYPILLIFLLFYGAYGGLYNQYSYLIPLDLARVHGDNGALIYGSVNTLNCIVVVIFTPLFTRYLAKLSEINKITVTYLLIGISYILLRTWIHARLFPPVFLLCVL